MGMKGIKRMKRRAGATLLEMLIVCGIVSIILVSVGNLIRAGVDYYFYSTTQLEVQRSGLLCLSILTQEFTASTYESVYTDNNPPNPGFVFAISKDTAGGSGPERSPWRRGGSRPRCARAPRGRGAACCSRASPSTR